MVLLPDTPEIQTLRERAKREEEVNPNYAQASLARAKALRENVHIRFPDSDGEQDEENDNNNVNSRAPSSSTQSEDDNSASVQPPGPCHVPVHGGLMIYLFEVTHAFILAGLGNPCRYLRLYNWTNDSHGKMDARRLTNFVLCLPFVEMVVNNTHGDGEIPWDRLIIAVPELTRPTALQMLGFRGLSRVGRQLETIYSKFLLSRNFALAERLAAAKAAHLEMVAEHLYFNPYLTSTNVKGLYFSRYQVIEGTTALLLMCEQQMNRAAVVNKKIEDGVYQDGLSEQTLRWILFKAGVLTPNSHLENFIGQLRWHCRGANLTGSNLLFSFRRLMARHLKRSGRLTAGKRRDYGEVRKQQLLRAKLVVDELVLSFVVQTLIAYLVGKLVEGML